MVLHGAKATRTGNHYPVLQDAGSEKRAAAASGTSYAIHVERAPSSKSSGDSESVLSTDVAWARLPTLPRLASIGSAPPPNEQSPRHRRCRSPPRLHRVRAARPRAELPPPATMAAA